MGNVKIKQFSDKNKDLIAGLTPEHAIYDKNGVRLDAKISSILDIKSTVVTQGKNLDNLTLKVNALAVGVFYGYASNKNELPQDITERGYAYVGTNNPYKIYNFDGTQWKDSGTTIQATSEADEEDITYNKNDKLTFKDRDNINGMGYIILRKNKSFASQVTKANTIYEIRYDFNIEENFEMPMDCVLKFDGGSITNLSHVFTLKNTRIVGYGHIFRFGEVKDIDNNLCNGDFGSQITGTITNDKILAEWFGMYTGNEDNTSFFQYAINTSFNLKTELFVKGSSDSYKVLHTIFLPRIVKMYGEAENKIPYNTVYTYSTHIKFAAKYLFRRKKDDASWDEQKRLTTSISANIRHMSFSTLDYSYGAYPREDGSVVAEDKANGDAYWAKKTYVFYGIVFVQSILVSIKTSNIGTFIYGAIRGLTQVRDCYIQYERNFICGGAGTISNGVWNTNHNIQLYTGISENEFGNWTSYTIDGKTYSGYTELAEPYATDIDSYDSYIENNYLNAGKFRAITFYNFKGSDVIISRNYIDFAFIVYCDKASPSNIVFSSNTIDICWIAFAFIGEAQGVYSNNNITRCNRNYILNNTRGMAWWDGDYTIDKDYAEDYNTDAPILSATKNMSSSICFAFDDYYGIRDFSMTGNTFSNSECFCSSRTSIFRRSKNINISGNNFSMKDDSLNIRFTNSDDKPQDWAISNECENIYVQQWDVLSFSDWEYVALNYKYSHTPSSTAKTYLAQNRNTKFVVRDTGAEFMLDSNGKFAPINILSTESTNYYDSFYLGKQIPINGKILIQDTKIKRWGIVNKDIDYIARDCDGFKVKQKIFAGWVLSPEEGYQQYNSQLKKWGYYNGTQWLSLDGTNIEKSGSIRPTNPVAGTCFLDLSLATPKPIWWTGTKWVDATGTDV